MDKHVEKVVLGIAALVALIVIWVFWLNSPYEVEVRGAADPKAPGEIGPFIAQKGVRLYNETLNPKSPDFDKPKFELPAEVRNADVFRRELDRDPLDEPSKYPVNGQATRIVKRFIGGGLPGVPESVIKPKVGPVPVYAVAPPPAPNLVSVRHRYDVAAQLDDPNEDKRLVELIGASEPRDFFSVLVRGEFDQEALSKLWAGAPVEQRLPLEWRQPAVKMMIDVVLEREQWDPIDQKWIDRQVIDRIPSDKARQVRSIDAASMTTERRNQVLDILGKNQLLIREPAFLKLAKGIWTPTAGNLTPDQLKALMKISEDILKKEQLRVQTERRIELIRKRASTTPAVRPDRTGGNTGYRPGGYEDEYEDGYEDYEDGGHSAPSTPARPATPFGPTGTTAQTPLEKSEALLRKLEQEIVELQQLKEELISQVDGTETGEEDALDPDQRIGTEPDDRRRPSNGGLFGDVEEEEPDETPAQVAAGLVLEPVPVWAHDITVKSGRTYRYRLVVKMLNPLFGKSGLNEKQEAESGKLMIASQPSKWSEPVVIPARMHYFVKKVDRNGVTVEVYVLHNGLRQSGELRLKPGDAIAGNVPLADGTTARVVTNAVIVGIMPGGSGQDARAIIAQAGQDRLAQRDAFSDQNSSLIKQIRAENDVRKAQDKLSVKSPWGGSEGYEDGGYEDEYEDEYEPGMYEDEERY
jgi:hypothetical protein